jgi:hypothetical protein
VGTPIRTLAAALASDDYAPFPAGIEGGLLATHEFKFVVSDVRLTKAQQATVGAAVAQAGALALAEVTPPNAVSVQIGINRWWRGIPAPEILKQLEQFAKKSAGPV